MSIDTINIGHTQIIDIYADFRNSIPAGRNKVNWGPGGLYREIEPNRKIFLLFQIIFILMKSEILSSHGPKTLILTNFTYNV